MEKIKLAVNNELNTGQALAVLSGLVAAAEQGGVDIKKLQPFLEQIDELLGLDLSNRKDISAGAKDIIVQREVARQSSNWAKADELRKQLLEQSIEVNDTPHGPVWSQKS